MKVFILISSIFFFSNFDLKSQNIEKKIDKKLELPDMVDSVILAGHGKFLLLKYKNLDTLDVFDLISEKIIGTVPLGGNDTLVGGTADNIILINQTKNFIQKWTIKPLSKVAILPLSLNEQVIKVVAGYSSNSTYMILTKSGACFFDLNNLKMLNIKIDNDVNFRKWKFSEKMNVFVSADGSTYVADDRLQGVRYIRLDGINARTKYLDGDSGHVMPNEDGSVLFSTDGRILTPLLTDSRRNLDLPAYFTAIHPAFYLGIVKNKSSQDDNIIGVYLYNMNDKKDFLELKNLNEIVNIDDKHIDFNSDKLPLSNRVFAYPNEKKIVYLGSNQKRLYLLPLDIESDFKERGIDYIYLNSAPVTTISTGKNYEYSLNVISKAGKLKYTLVKGPNGMTINLEGVVSWLVPKNYELETTEVSIKIEDAKEQSLLHNYVIYKFEPPKVAQPLPPKKK